MLNDSYGNMPLFGNGGHISSSCAPEISRIILHLLSSSGVFPFLVSRQRILYSQSFDTVKYLSDPNDTLCPPRRQAAMDIGLQKYDEGI